MRALAIVSGGLDSVTMLYEYKDKVKHVVTFNYGSNHNAQEIERARWNCKNLGKEHTVINLEEAFQDIESALLSGADAIPSGEYTTESLKQTVVPFRNGIMLSIAAGIAESKGCDTVLIGAHAGDHEVYPDCREGFMNFMSLATEVGTDAGIAIQAPYIQKSKAHIAGRALGMNVPVERTYSCYKGGPIHCGVCSTCIERRKALEGQDPTEYLETPFLTH